MLLETSEKPQKKRGKKICKILVNNLSIFLQIVKHIPHIDGRISHYALDILRNN